MSDYHALARTWRPQNFEQMVGQDVTVQTLSRALEHQRLHHAYLFTGQFGIGKTTLARIFAKCLNCATAVTPRPCETCLPCQSIKAGHFTDLIEVDAASRTKVEDTRTLLENVAYTPHQGRYKVYLIDEVHMLSTHSFNALLKTLEEPPEHVIFLLATTDPQRLPPTVLSRCLQFHLKPLTLNQISAYLEEVLIAEKIPFETSALRTIAQNAQGSMRNALSLLDQAIAYGSQNISNAIVTELLGHITPTHLCRLIEALIHHDAQQLMDITAQLSQETSDFEHLLETLIALLHQIACLHALPETVMETHRADHATARALAEQLTAENAQLFYQIALTGYRDLALNPTPRIGFEMTLLRMLAFQLEEQTAARPTSVKTEPTAASHQASTTRTLAPKPIQPPSTDWTTIVSAMQLPPITKALARHCTLSHVENDTLFLALDPTQAPLLNEKQQQRLDEALTLYFKKPMRASITQQKTKQPTPASTAAEQAKRAETAQQAALQSEPNVRALQTKCDAEITEYIKRES